MGGGAGKDNTSEKQQEVERPGGSRCPSTLYSLFPACVGNNCDMEDAAEMPVNVANQLRPGRELWQITWKPERQGKLSQITVLG